MPAGGLGTRDRALETLAHPGRGPFDLLVVGGGITGAGIALDAASRGLRTALVERRDFASGTSSKSSKLVHGGLRYLEQREFSLVREASTERELLGTLAPHLVEPIPFVIPVSDRWKRAVFGVGLWAYDALSSFKNLRIHQHLSREEIEEMLPALPRDKVRGGYLFYDSRTDDVRLVMEVLLQARRHGAVVANYVAVDHIEGSGDACAVTVTDVLGGETFELGARKVIVAAGVWGDEVEAVTGGGGERRLRPSKGIHLVFSRDAIPVGEAAGFIPDAERRRMLFVVPWLDSVLVGTTDTPYEGELDHPSVEDEDRRYCLDAVNAAFDLSLSESDIAGAYAGLRPLVAGKAGATADLSRRHSVYDIAPGVIGITGGKLTTYRRMARDAVDRVASDLGVPGGSRTGWIRLGSSDVAALRLAVDRRAERLGMSLAQAAELVRCFGDRALAVLEIAEERGGDLAGALVPGHRPIAAAAAYCARREMAATLEDVLARRTRLALTDRDAGLGRGSRAAEVVAKELGWSRLERRRRVSEYRRQIEAERGLPLGDQAPAPAPAEDAG
jgi:glycerol-3-phosphate dehydrogenase